MIESMRRFKAEVFKALAHPTRIAIIEQLCVGEISVGRLCETIGIEQANASQHLAVLRNKHLVETRKQANQIVYRLRDPALGTVLEALRKFFLAHLSDALELLREEQQNGGPTKSMKRSKPSQEIHPRWRRQSRYSHRRNRDDQDRLKAPGGCKVPDDARGRLTVAFPRKEQFIMQLTIRDVIKFLDVSESTVTRWIKRRGMPAQYVGGQYRFNRAELLEWATANQIKVSLQMFDQMEADSQPVPTLTEALDAGGIFHGLHVADKGHALRALVEVLPLPEEIDRELVLQLFLAREASASTAIGDGIAIPHVRNPIVLHVSQPMVTLAFLEQPVDFGALDGKPVDVLFSIISPTNRSHLQLLSRLSFALHDERFREAVTRHAPREQITEELRRVESGMGAAGGAGGMARSPS